MCEKSGGGLAAKVINDGRRDACNGNYWSYFQEAVRNCLDGEETAGQNSWELLGSGWEEGMRFFFCFFSRFVFREDEDGEL